MGRRAAVARGATLSNRQGRKNITTPRVIQVKRVVASCVALLLPALCLAEEGGSGHYMPGSISSFIDGTPASETFATRLNVVYYDGKAGAGERLPIGGLNTLNAEATSWALGLTLLWRPSLDLGERWSYAMSATIPFVWLDLTADVVVTGPGGNTTTISRSPSQSGLGDVVLMPVMLSYGVNKDVHFDFRLGVYAPSGNYQLGRLANTGKNFWTIEPTVGLQYLGQKNGREASLYFGTDFNSENSATNYKSGTQMHLDGTLAQHFPMFGGLAGVGLSAYYYDQVSGDSGSGATYGAFKAKTMGLGPAFSFVSKVGGKDTVLEAKWLHETDTKNRLQGDVAWLKVVVKW
jgi:hypothetical protein